MVVSVFFFVLLQTIEHQSKMKKVILSALAATMLLTACQESLEERCAREAKEYTAKHCPAQIAQDIVMDSMSFDRQTRTIGYHYTLSGNLDNSLTINKNQPREQLLMEVKNSTNLKLYKDEGYSFRYVYYSAKNSGTKLFEATFRKNDYR